MKGFINAFGKSDSQGRDRLNEIRGLVEFGGKPVIDHILEKFQGIGIDYTLIFVNPEHKEAYDKALQTYPVKIEKYDGPSNPLQVFFAGLKQLAGDDVLLLADDNLFDFSLEGLIRKFRDVDDNVMAIGNIVTEQDLNFATCNIDESGKVLVADFSWAPEVHLDAEKVIFDIYLVHRKRVQELISNPFSVKEAIHSWYKDFYAWEPKEGVWFDIGKPELRREAEKYFK